MNDRIDALIDLWFGDWTEDRPMPEGGGPQMKLWWGKDPEVDDRLRRDFGAANAAAAQGQLDGWADTDRGLVALVLLLDQISRNIHRDTAGMFANDPRARRLVHDAIASGRHEGLPLIHRYFLYMPLMHSEDLADHDLAVACFTGLLSAAETAGSRRLDAYGGGVEYEHKHRDIIARFGRYPHRNALLDRTSTPEELAFLEQPGSSF